MFTKIFGLLSILIIVCAVALACSSEPEYTEVERVAPAPAQPAPAPTAAPAPVIREVEKIVEVEVIKEVQVPGETIVVEKEVVKEIQVPGETVVVEKEVVKEVEVEVVKEVQLAPAAAPTMAPAPAQAMQAASAPTAMPAAPAPAMQQSAPQATPPQPQSQSSWGQRGSGSQPGATTFRDYERSLPTRTSDDSVSTFSLDTDRTSFQLALNWARAGYDVEPDSVRSEEWVNAFDYRYEQPRRDDSFAIHTDVMPHPLHSDLVLARIGFQAPELRDDGRPLNVTLVLDSSGSMNEGNRVEIARAAADSIRRSLRDEDRISVVHFRSNVMHDLTVENHKPGSRKVRDSINRLSPGGSTNVQAGLNLGVEIADYMRRKNPSAYNYVILMSDGVANVDATNPFAILESAEDRDSSNPLRLITIGVGIQNYNDVLLEQLAQHGNGWYRYLNDPGQAKALFSRENWLALSIPFADQTRAQVTWNPEAVESWRIVGYENRITADRNFTQARKEFAEIPSGAATTVFYELRPTEYLHTGDTVNLGDVELRWVTPVSNDSNRQHAQIAARYDMPSNDTNGALIRFGVVVALAADRYSSLPYPDAPYDVQYDLSILQDELRSLDEHIGGLASYQDFAFVMDRITTDVPQVSSGYSR